MDEAKLLFSPDQDDEDESQEQQQQEEKETKPVSKRAGKK